MRIGSVGSGAPGILVCGTDEQKRYYFRRCSGGNSRSPRIHGAGCGTDLAGINAARSGPAKNMSFSGQKIYVTVPIRDAYYLMVRTDPQSRRHQGLSILLVPMDTPGVAVRPLWTLQNDRKPARDDYRERRVNEVFFADAEVPADCLLARRATAGIGHASLNLDRVGAFRYLIFVMRDEDIVNWLNSEGAGIAKRSIGRPRQGRDVDRSSGLPSDDDAKPVVVMRGAIFPMKVREKSGRRSTGRPCHRGLQPDYRSARELLSSSFAAVSKAFFAQTCWVRFSPPSITQAPAMRDTGRPQGLGCRALR